MKVYGLTLPLELAPSGHMRNCSLLHFDWWLHFSSVIHGGTQSSYHKKKRVKWCIYCGILMCKSFTSKLCHCDISFLCWTPTHSVRNNLSFARLCVICEWEDVCFLSVKSSLLISCGDVWNLSAQTFSLALKLIFTTKIFNLPAAVFPQLVDNLHSSRISPCAIYFLLSASYWPIFQHLSIGSQHEWVWHDFCCELNLKQNQFKS